MDTFVPQAQGYAIVNNVVYQDNQSTILLEYNGKMSSSKQTRHIEIQYFFVTDNIRKKNLQIEYCPTDHMLADFFTKPLQGAKFWMMRPAIMNLPIDAMMSTLKECVGNTGTAADRAFDTSESDEHPDTHMSHKKVYVVPGRVDDELKSATSWVDVLRHRSSGKAKAKQSEDHQLTLFC